MGTLSQCRHSTPHTRQAMAGHSHGQLHGSGQSSWVAVGLKLRYTREVTVEGVYSWGGAGRRHRRRQVQAEERSPRGSVRGRRQKKCQAILGMDYVR